MLKGNVGEVFHMTLILLITLKGNVGEVLDMTLRILHMMMKGDER